MLENWLSPVQTDQVIDLTKLSSHHWGKHMAIFRKKIPNIQKSKLVLIGINQETADPVRRHLYTLTKVGPSKSLADLGNLINVHPESIIPVLKECLAGGLIPILIGAHPAHTYAQYLAYQPQHQLVNLLLINERIPYSVDQKQKEKDYFFLNRILDDKKSFLFHLSLLGYQTHFISPQVLKHMEAKNVDLIRLGRMKPLLEHTEPVLRDADMISFDLSAFKHSDAPAALLPSPNGLLAEDGCRIAHFAGFSDKLTSIGFYGYRPEQDPYELTAQLIAQMIWYFAEGYFQRMEDLPIQTSKFVKYVVDMKEAALSLTFWKSKKSERWWMQVPNVSHRKKRRHRLIPCSFNDYQLACQNELPDRLLNAYHRFE